MINNSFFTDYEKDIIRKTQDLIRIPSIYEKSSNYKMPFGKNINEALEYILHLADSLGFRTKNLDGYCGYIEFGSGKDLVGIASHLDVVPAKGIWKFPPFEAKMLGNKIYGRGAVDDKGPTIASLYAMKVIKENFKISKRVRLIIGLNEENDWKCIDYYKKHAEIPCIGFSPDANFPCIYAEKSVLSTFLNMNYTQFLKENIVIST